MEHATADTSTGGGTSGTSTTGRRAASVAVPSLLLTSFA